MPIPIEAVDKMVQEEGEEVLHAIGMRCFCHGADGQPDPNCTEHENGGWLYTEATPIVGLVTDITQRRELMETGAFFPGDCIFSPLTDTTISEGDKITFTWALPHGQGDVLLRGEGPSDELYYAAQKGMVCLDEHKTFYKQERDYRLEGKAIVWAWDGKDPAAKTPPPGTRYSFKYYAFFEWLAFVPPVHRITAGENLGDKVMLRKKHLVESR